MRASNTFSLAAAELVRERDVLLHALADATLRSKGKRAVADRDKWEELARQRECELAELRSFASNDDKFKRVKAFISKVLHPDSNRNAGEIEAAARTLLFKEIWPEIMKIDRGAS
jgi:hypothetical protein